MTTPKSHDIGFHGTWPADRRLVYVVDVPATTHGAGLVLELATEKRTVSGGWEPPVTFRLGADVWHSVPDQVDRQIAQMLIGASPSVSRDNEERTSGFVLRGSALETTVRLMCDTGRCRVRMTHADRPLYPVRWDNGPAWRLRLRIAPQRTNCYSVTLVLQRPGQEMPLAEPVILHEQGFLLVHSALGRFEHGGAYALVNLFRERASIVIGESELPALLESLYAIPNLPPIELPPDTGLTEVRAEPLSCLTIFPDPNPGRGTHHMLAPGFLYGKTRISGDESGDSVFDREAVAIRYRDFAFEAASRERLLSLGAREEWIQGAGEKCLTIVQSRLGEMIAELVRTGWRVDADGAAYRSAGDTRATVRSGIDWFELDAAVKYGDMEVPLHDLLEARRAGNTTVTLSDGSVGLLPLDWLARLGPLAAGGVGVGGTIRYSVSQMVLLDALLDTLPEAQVDATFEQARAELHSFDRISPADPVEGFQGTLREYQREGLGWLHFLRRFKLGGCLADDMGLGKTVQVLALLDSRRQANADEPRPSLVVVPRSLVFNWIREAERFTPHLRLLDYSGTGRDIEAIDPAAVDVVITTYGTLRRDAAALGAIRFDYAVLDEAQAIKNASSASAKAARLIKADHRLAMTGTPIENRLEELWSLFEFLNPGMLGRSSAFSKLVRLADSDNGSGSRDLLASALRPVILRRTKDQVAQDLPARIEQTLTVELEGAQRKFYDALLADYRSSVLDRVDRVG
ncbi:MAG: SNF2-related protein, partial [Gemmatimonadaceae bacterium]